MIATSTAPGPSLHAQWLAADPGYATNAAIADLQVAASELLNQALEVAGITKLELSRRLNLSYPAVCNLFARPVSLKTLAAVCAAVGMRVVISVKPASTTGEEK